jgi:hypothetical protein
MIDARVTDAAALAARSPSELAFYLRSRGWTLRHYDGTAAFWSLVVDDDDFEVLQPLESGIRDYSSRVRDLLQVLAVVETRSELDILRDISNASIDVHSVRTFPGEMQPGTIGLDDAVAALESLRNLVVAAAYAVSATQPRAVQPARKPAEVLRFLRDIRLGPTSEGSFIFTVQTLVPPRLTAGKPSLFEMDATKREPAEPYERRVSLMIYDAARAAHDAANDALINADGLDGFTRRVPHGISANLCEALVQCRVA